MDLSARNAAVGLTYALIRSGLRPPAALLRLNQTYLERIYLRDLLRRFKIDCVLDVGADTGSFARNLRRIGYRHAIVSFEPNPASFSVLQDRFRRDANWRGWNLALGSENTEATLQVPKLSNLGSLLQPHAIAVDHQAAVKVRRLETLWNECVPDPNARIFLKLDTQGYDLEVVRGASSGIERVVVLQSEISVQPIYQGMPHYVEALRCYEALGFKLMNLFTVIRDKQHGGIMELDCLMARF